MRMQFFNPDFLHCIINDYLVSGTMFCMWLGERITDKGIGNGISMLMIMIGIVSRFPTAIYLEMDSKGNAGVH